MSVARWARAVAALTALGAAGAVAIAAAGPMNRPAAASPAGDPGRGRALATSCFGCHGDGAPLLEEPAFHAPKLRHQRPSALFYALQDYREGRRRSDLMEPVAQSLTDQDMRDLAAYLTGERVTPHPAQARDSWGHAKTAEVCGACHGETGLGVMEGYPVIGGQHQDYIEHALEAYRTGDRRDPTMATVARSLSAGESHRIAEYFAAQHALEPAR